MSVHRVKKSSPFKQKPDFYSSKEECENSVRNVVCTNPRYSTFNQTHFTAGDVDQFFESCPRTNMSDEIPSLHEDLFDEKSIWEKNTLLEPISVMNTFHYLFHKFKKGIYVKIQNNELKIFLPFSKKNYTNEWHTHIRVDPKYKSFTDYFKTITPTLKDSNVNKYVDSWYGNGSLVRYEFPINEGDTNNSNLRDMLVCLCKERKVPDIEFFLNRRDFPVIKRDGTEAYEDLFENTECKLVSHNYEKYTPILSMVGRPSYADIPIPTGDDWARVEMGRGKFFVKNCRDYQDTFNTDWKDKKNIAVFRGASTGKGTCVETNMRLKLAKISTENKSIIDAGITNWNVRPKKTSASPYLSHIDPNTLPFGLVHKLTPAEQSKYKYVIHVDGHVAAFRLSFEMSMGCCLLINDSDYFLWFRKRLTPFSITEHNDSCSNEILADNSCSNEILANYIPIKHDLSDLVETVNWCIQHDDVCKKISENAKKFYDTYLSRDGVLDYTQSLLCLLKKKVGNYRYTTLTIREIQQSFLEKKFVREESTLFENEKFLNRTIPSIPRTYGVLKAIEKMIKVCSLDQPPFKKEKVIFTNSNGNVCKYSFMNEFVVVKTIDEKNKYYEGLHEYFIAFKKLNELKKIIPNFCYVYSLRSQEYSLQSKENKIRIISEYVPGEMLSTYILGDNFVFSEFILILYILCLALHVAQTKAKFVHNDFVPWNIVLKRHSTLQELEYPISPGKVIKVKTFVVPVIIDYGKSHIVCEIPALSKGDTKADVHFGNVNPFRFNTFHDITCLLFASLFEFLQHSDVKRYTSEVLYLGNYFTGGEFHEKPFTSLSELKHFLFNAKKFSELVYLNTKELSERTPLDFAQFLKEKWIKDKAQETFGLSWKRTHDPDQIIEFVLATTKEEKVESFRNVLKKYGHANDSSVRALTMYPVPVSFVKWYTSFNILKRIDDTMNSLKEYATSLPEYNGLVSDNIRREYEQTRAVYTLSPNEITTSLSVFAPMIVRAEQSAPLDYGAKENSVSATQEITEETFLYPSHVLEIISGSLPIRINRRTELNESLYELAMYAENWRFVKEYIPSETKQSGVDIQTLIKYGKKIYEKDLKSIDCEYRRSFIKLINM